jgi:hypothetical protein
VERNGGVGDALCVGVVAAWLVLGAACSSDPGSEDGAPATSASIAATSFPTGSTLNLTTSTSEASTTSTSPTTAPSPTALTSAVDPGATADAAVRAAVDKAIADFRSCLLALPSCDPAMLAASRSGPMLAANTERITEWNAAGYKVVDRDQFRYMIEAVELAGDLRRATATVCVADGSKLVQPGAGPGGADVIIDDTYMSGREAWDVRLDPDGVWRAYDAPVVGSTEATDVCPGA